MSALCAPHLRYMEMEITHMRYPPTCSYSKQSNPVLQAGFAFGMGSALYLTWYWATPREAERNPQRERGRHADVRHSHGTGSVHPADVVAGHDTDLGDRKSTRLN